MNLEFRIKYCKFCLNRGFNPSKGLICGLPEEPIINNRVCASYLPNTELIELENHKIRINKAKEIKKSRAVNIKNVLFAVPLLALLVIVGVEWITLESDYRYTLAKVHVTHQSGSDKILGIGGYRCEFEYAFEVNGRTYYKKGSLGTTRGGGLPEPIWPTKFIVKYSPSDPALCDVLPEIDTENLKFENIPTNGIHSDSLNFFLMNYKVNNN